MVAWETVVWEMVAWELVVGELAVEERPHSNNQSSNCRHHRGKYLELPSCNRNHNHHAPSNEYQHCCSHLPLVPLRRCPRKGRLLLSPYYLLTLRNPIYQEL